MRYQLIILFLLYSLSLAAQEKGQYLVQNRFDLRSTDFSFPQQDFHIIGFGAYHGSAKTEEVELRLLGSLLEQGMIKYYLIESDYSLAHYFNEYLHTGDTLLLKELVTYYGLRVPQERTIAVYEKWKRLKVLQDRLPEADRLKVLGIDYMVSYRFASRHLIDLLAAEARQLEAVQSLFAMVETDTTSFAKGDQSYATRVLQALVKDYQLQPAQYQEYISDLQAFEHLLTNLQYSLEPGRVDRDKVMFDNYQALASRYDFANRAQFVRMGFTHVQKAREGEEGYPYFFTHLMEQGVYQPGQIISVMGYFTNSEVVWDELFDEAGNYTGYTTEAGYGIGDYELEYFRGIQQLKDQKVSDMTLYRLNQERSPYAAPVPDLIEVIMQEEESNGEAVKGMSTLSFIDYAILISDSRASRPVFELDRQ